MTAIARLRCGACVGPRGWPWVGGRCRPGRARHSASASAPKPEQDAADVQTEVPEVPEGLNKYSGRVTQPKSQGASQAMLFATGLREADMGRPQVGIGAVWLEGNPCNMHLLDLAAEVKESAKAVGLVPYRFCTTGVSDAISEGTQGMRYSLQSRDLIADSIESTMGAQWYDAFIGLAGSDKNMPGTLIGMGRLNRPALMVYGGSIKPGRSRLSGEPLDIISALQSYGAYNAGLITEEERYDIVRNACPGAGSPGGMYTANTMAAVGETLGMTLPYSSSTPAEDPMKRRECQMAGAAVLEMLKADIRPKDVMTRQSFDNAMAVVMALGGSTNAVLHLIAIARSVGIELTLDDFQRVSDRVPVIADVRPTGRYRMVDLHRVGGVPAVLKYLLAEGIVDGSGITVTGKTMAENLAAVDGLAEGQDVIMPIDRAIKSSGHIQIIYGNLAKDGAVAKISGKEGFGFKGPALCFDSEEAMLGALFEDASPFKGKVVIIRYEGPKGGPGMREMLNPTSAIITAGLAKECALVTDGRFSGGSQGFVIGHVTPEAQEGGVIGLVRDGDEIAIDIKARRMDVAVSAEELEKRREEWVAPPFKATSGTLYKYIKCVAPATLGCVTDL